MALLSSLPVGAKVKDPNTKYYGQPIVFTIAAKNHNGYPSGAITLLTEKVIMLKAYDAKEINNTNGLRKTEGNNRYLHSNIRQWLNALTTGWYSAQHTADAPPNEGHNIYGPEAGFLYNFSQKFRNALLTTPLIAIKANVDGGGTENLSDKVFLPSYAEVFGGLSDGFRFELFDSFSRIAYPTDQAISNSTFKDATLTTSRGWMYFLRTPYNLSSSLVQVVSETGMPGYKYANDGTVGIRPALNLPSNIGVSDTVDSDGAYVITWNDSPTITVNSPIDARTLYESDTFGISGNVNDTNIGDVVSVKYSIDGGAAQAITAIVSTGSAASFAKNLTYKSGKLFDGATALTDTLAEGSQHTLKIWAEDDKGGKSSEIIRTFYVVPNRAASLTLDAFVTRTGLINTDIVNIAGAVSDLDNGNVIVKYKIGNGAFVQVFNNTVGATPTPFNFNVLIADLADGENQITIQAVDAYNAITQRVLNIHKSKNEIPLLEAVTYYEITPPNGTADGLQLYVEREVGDLVVSADVFMGANGETEVFVPMTLASTANLTNGNVEDTFSYEHSTDATKIVVRINMTRSSAATNKAIKKISGVLT